jgi:hypothetical protein
MLGVGGPERGLQGQPGNERAGRRKEGLMDVQHLVESPSPDPGTIEYESWLDRDPDAIVHDASRARDAGAIEFDSWRKHRGERGSHG